MYVFIEESCFFIMANEECNQQNVTSITKCRHQSQVLSRERVVLSKVVVLPTERVLDIFSCFLFFCCHILLLISFNVLPEMMEDTNSISREKGKNENKVM
jgi:hypothetical protein